MLCYNQRKRQGMKEVDMARFNGGTLEELFDDSGTMASRSAVRSEIEAASAAADGAELAMDERAAELDAAAFTCYECCKRLPIEMKTWEGPDYDGDLAAFCIDCYAAEIAEGELAHDRERCIDQIVPDPHPNVFACNWHELIEARADQTRLNRYASDWDLTADLARAAALRIVPDAATILVRLLGRPNKRAAGKAAQAIVEGVKIRREGDALHIASQSEAGREWVVTSQGCGCRASGHCWHCEVHQVIVGGVG
jgi:hypothetical protein